MPSFWATRRMAGPHDIELTFGGQIIAESGVDGPYTIRSAHLDDVGTIPPHQGEPVAVLASTLRTTRAIFTGPGCESEAGADPIM